MPDALAIASDLVAITVLTYGIYFRRHRRRDMLLAYVALNIGVMAVAIALLRLRSAPVSAWGSSACCRSSACARRRSHRKRSPTTSCRWRWVCLPASISTRPGSAPHSWPRIGGGPVRRRPSAGALAVPPAGGHARRRVYQRGGADTPARAPALRRRPTHRGQPARPGPRHDDRRCAVPVVGSLTRRRAHVSSFEPQMELDVAEGKGTTQ